MTFSILNQITENSIKRRKEFQIIKAFVCAFCFHLLNVADCLSKLQIGFKLLIIDSTH